MRFKAPKDVTAVTLSCGEVRVSDGAISVPDDIAEGDLLGLRASGFMPCDDAAATAIAPEPAPADEFIMKREDGSPILQHKQSVEPAPAANTETPVDAPAPAPDKAK